MKIVRLSEGLGVTAQITPEDVAEIAAAGYRVLVNNRPDNEDSSQPGSAALAAAARSAGLAYYALPVTAQTFPGSGFAEMRALLDDASRPVLAFCRTGTRSANLWVASREGAARDRAIATARQHGFDLAMATAFFARDAQPG